MLFDTRQLAYIDIFSCSFINCEELLEEVERALGVSIESVLISRGSKHTTRLADREDYIDRYNAWQYNIR